MISQYISGETMEKIVEDIYEAIHEKMDAAADALDIPLSAIDYDFCASDTSFIFLRKDMTKQDQAEDLANMLSTAMSDVTAKDFTFDESSTEEGVRDFAITFELDLNF